MRWLRAVTLLAACALVGERPPAQTDIARTVHNLTPGGPGAVKESVPTGLCVFCHTPHNANPQISLWNRDLPGLTYQLYASSTLRATLNQPTGTSRLCLSCHDGVMALGNLRTPAAADTLKLGPLTGPTRLGTDLSDDHPISFTYDSALVTQHPGLVEPGSLPSAIRLAGGKLECSTCHNAHEHRRAQFLRMDNANGALCLACHSPPQWAGSDHANSSAVWNGSGVRPWPPDGAATVAANACRNCHRSHSAGHGPRLLAWRGEAENCSVCHGGTVSTKNVAAEFANGAKFSRHPIDAAEWTHDPQENPATMARHVTCSDCHNPHAANSRPAAPPLVPGALQGVPGVSIGGTTVAQASFEYEVCLKCHGLREPTTPGLTRVETTRVVRTRIDPANASYHPIAAPGRNATIKGLRAPYTAASTIGCIDCHNNSDLVPRGAHASRFAPILERGYSTSDPQPESLASYDLCYKCHDRGTLLSSASGFPHAKHVVEKQAPCAACHDAHGSQKSPHLINFLLRDTSGKAVVTANSRGQLQYVSTLGGGSCSLTCHGEEHTGLAYGAAARLVRPLALPGRRMPAPPPPSQPPGRQ
ncbi:MAG TPA: cytochrome c3 family protein [Burkholderiaceae bacterium]|nr:cytochrome c3 family protein [Burkholderiaceae bacterium]